MSLDLGLNQESPLPDSAVRNFSPIRTLTTLTILIFLAEIVAMIILYGLELPNYPVIVLLDGTIMLALISPALYFFQLKPLLTQIDERTQVERALRTNEETLQKVLELLPVGVWIIDKDGKIIHGNPASQEIWAGVRYGGVQQYKEYKGWWPDSGKAIEPGEWASIRAINRRETTLNEEIFIEALDGTHKTILNSALPILDDEGSLQGAVVVNQDITQRRKMEQSLIRSNELLERIFASVDTLIAYMDRDIRFIRVNASYAQIGGHSPEFYIGKNYFDLFPNEENLAVFRNVIESGEPFSAFEKPFEFPAYRDQDAAYWDWSLQPVLGSKGEVDGLVLSLVDVTERVQAQIQLERQNQELLALSKAERRQRELAETLGAAAQALPKTLALEQVLDTLLVYIQKIVHSDVARVTLLEDETNLAVRASSGLVEWADQRNIPSFPIDYMKSSDIQKIVSAGESIAFPNHNPDWAQVEQFGGKPGWNWLVTPIVTGHKIIGLVELGRAGSENFDPQLTRWTEALVSQASVAIQNAWLFQQVRSSSERLKSLARKLVEIQENERYFIARELHDESAQALSSLKLTLGHLEQDPDCPPHVRQKLEDLKGVADSVLEELHRLAVNLRPIVLDHLGLVPALEQVATNLSSDGLVVRFKVLGLEGTRLPKDVETGLYRIVQEALANVVRHARASNVGILLERGNDCVKLFVEDDGIGFNPYLPEYSDRLGLVGMRERAEMFGGSLTLESQPGMGTSIIVEVPDDDPNSYSR